MLSVRRASCRWIVSLLVFLSAAGVASAQATCFGPDGLDGTTATCCQPGTVNLPNFPIIQNQGIKYVAFNNCGTQLNVNICATIGPPTPVQVGGANVCGIYLIRFTIFTCGAGTVLWSGSMRAQYSRTWLEQASGTSPDTQVWRFLLNGDFVPSTALPTGNPNVFAPCIPAFGNRMHVWGYIDYAGTCTSAPTFQVAWALNHGCDFSEHGPPSFRPGAFHPTRSYTWLGPSAGFVVDPLNTPFSNGTANLGQDAVRRNAWGSLPSICLIEEPLQISSIIPNGPLCVCGAGGPQYDRSILRIVGLCGTQAFAVPTLPIPFMQKRIGRWTSTTAFPGVEHLLLDEGHVQHIDGCAGGAQSVQYIKGVQTIGGFPAFKATSPPIPLDPTFEDFGTANIGPGSSGIRIGAPYVTWFIMNINVP
jgi:hypothetical protein